MEKLTSEQISQLEETLKVKFPSLYRELLTQIGHGEFIGPEGAFDRDIQEIYHPGEIYELYEPFFDEPEMLFTLYFPFGCNNKTQDLWIINLETNQAATIGHETVPDDWEEEDWLSYPDWVKKYSPFDFQL